MSSVQARKWAPASRPTDRMLDDDFAPAHAQRFVLRDMVRQLDPTGQVESSYHAAPRKVMRLPWPLPGEKNSGRAGSRSRAEAPIVLAGNFGYRAGGIGNS
jgi:hypothetical protein